MSTPAQRIITVLAGLEQGRITAQEADAFLRATCNITLADARRLTKPKTTVLPLIALILLLGGVIVFFLPGDLTGYAVLNTGENTSVTSVRVTGILQGEGTAIITFSTPTRDYLVATITSDDGTPRTDQPSYDSGMPVHVDHLPVDATIYFDDGITNTPVRLPFNAANGTLLIVTTNTTYRLPVTIGSAPRITTFTSVCDETCALLPTTGMIATSVSGNATLTIATITTTTPHENTPPTLSRPFAPIALNTMMTMNLNEYFTDPDGDELFYTVGSNDIVNASIAGSVLTITPVQDGTTFLTIYASDLYELVPATIPLNIIALNTGRNDTATQANVTIVANDTAAVTLNAMENASPAFNTTIAPNATNESVNDTSVSYNTTVTSDCLNPDPNQRPLECIQNATSTYFNADDIAIESKTGERVGKLTPIGNLVIRGSFVEHTTGSPGSADWQRGYQDADGNFVPTVWIDTSTGDLYLRGALTEANTNIVFQQPYTAMMNRRGIILALIDPRTGDVILRGGVMTRRSTR